MVENLTKMADQQPRYQVLLFLLKAASPPSTIWQQLNTVNEVNTAPPYVGLIVQIFFHQKAPGLTLSIQQHRSYLQYVLILSEPEPLCLDKLIAETLPLLEAPPVVCLVHLQKLLCGVTFDCSSSSNASPLIVLLRQGVKKLARSSEKGVLPRSGWKNIKLRTGVVRQYCRSKENIILFTINSKHIILINA